MHIRILLLHTENNMYLTKDEPNFALFFLQLNNGASNVETNSHARKYF